MIDSTRLARRTTHISGRTPQSLISESLSAKWNQPVTISPKNQNPAGQIRD
jgi:hypothetical protein